MASSRASFKHNNLIGTCLAAILGLTACAERTIVVSIHDRTGTRGERPVLAAAPTPPPQPPPPEPAPTPPLAGEISAPPPTSTGEERVLEPLSSGFSSSPVAAEIVPAAPAVAAVVIASDVYFDFDRYDLAKAMRRSLKEQAKRLRAEKRLKVIVEGHCDERGTRDYNLLLGERRARVVKRALEEMGLVPSRIHTTSYGKERPFCAQHSDACWRQNRRVHLTIQ